MKPNEVVEANKTNTQNDNENKEGEKDGEKDGDKDGEKDGEPDAKRQKLSNRERKRLKKGQNKVGRVVLSSHQHLCPSRISI